VKKGQNGRKSLRRLKPTVGRNASKRRNTRAKLRYSANKITVYISVLL
jgi:hypothetical protein